MRSVLELIIEMDAITGKKIKDRRELSFEKAIVHFFLRGQRVKVRRLHEILTIAAIIKIDPLDQF